MWEVIGTILFLLVLLGLFAGFLGFLGYIIVDIWRTEHPTPAQRWQSKVDFRRRILDANDDLRYAALILEEQQPPQVSDLLLKHLKNVNDHAQYPLVYNNEGRRFRTLWEANHRPDDVKQADFHRQWEELRRQHPAWVPKMYRYD